MSDADPPPTPREVAEAVLFDPRQRSKLLRYAGTRFGIETADAEDLLQETALGLLRQRGSVRNPDGFAFATFRARCTRFVESRRLRRERLRPQTEEDESIPHEAVPEKIDRQVALREALNGISSSCRRLLSAYYIEGQSLNEAAQGLTLPYAIVSRRINRCLERLRACLN
jgi:RNA polymerase sigma factor (sigma-70 family)